MRVLCLYFPRIPIHLAAESRPDVAERPAAVLQGAGDSALVITTSVPAAAAGVTPGMTAAEARRRCPGTLFLPDNSGGCFDRLDRLASIIRVRATPLVAIGGADHLFVELSGTRRLYASEEIAAATLAGLAQTWLRVPVRAGVGGSREASLGAARAARFRPVTLPAEETAAAERPFVSYREEAVSVAGVVRRGPGEEAQVARLLARLQAVLDGRGEGFREANLVVETASAAVHARLEGLRYEARDLRGWIADRLSSLPERDEARLRVELRRLCPDARVREVERPRDGGSRVVRAGRQFPLRAAG